MKKEKRIKKDATTLRRFIKIYCREHHLKNGVAEEGGALWGMFRAFTIRIKKG